MIIIEKWRSLKRLHKFVHDLYNANIFEKEKANAFRHYNPNNYINIITNIPQASLNKLVHVDGYSYGELNVCSFIEVNEAGLYIGKFCSIARGNKFLLSGGHDYLRPTTYPFKHFFLHQGESVSKGPITLEDDVWMGENVTVLSGVTLRRGTVVAAGSVVTSSSEPYSIIGGVPAKHIKYRFSKHIIEKLSTIDYSKLTPEKIKENMDVLYEQVTEENVDNIVSILNS